MHKFILSTIILLISQISFSQNKDSDFYFNDSFSHLVKKSGINIEMDSLEGYLLTDQNELFAIQWDLVLIHPISQKILYLKYHSKPFSPPLAFSHLVTNVMDNEGQHSAGFYSLDPYFLLTYLHADWAADTRFKPKHYAESTAYARSFYSEETENQITILLIGEDLPYLKTSKEIQAFSFQSSDN